MKLREIKKEIKTAKMNEKKKHTHTRHFFNFLKPGETQQMRKEFILKLQTQMFKYSKTNFR